MTDVTQINATVMYSRQNTIKGICCFPEKSWRKDITAVTKDVISQIHTETHGALKITATVCATECFLRTNMEKRAYEDRFN